MTRATLKWVWFSSENSKPEAIYGEDKDGKVVDVNISDDVLLYWREVSQYGLGYYDHELKEWRAWNGQSADEPDVEPSHWQYLTTP